MLSPWNARSTALVSGANTRAAARACGRRRPAHAQADVAHAHAARVPRVDGGERGGRVGDDSGATRQTRATPSEEGTGCAGLCLDGQQPTGPGPCSTSGAGGGTGGVGALGLHEYKYAVVFLDNQMPVMSGLEAVAKLREMGRKDLVVGVTGMPVFIDYRLASSILTEWVKAMRYSPISRSTSRRVLISASCHRVRLAGD